MMTLLVLMSFFKGYMVKKGHKRKNWSERWFVLRPTALSYYESEDLLEKKGEIVLDQSCCVEVSMFGEFIQLLYFKRNIPVVMYSKLMDAFLTFNMKALHDKDGKKCLFIIKCADKSFEIRAPDKKKRQEWIQGA